MAGRTFLGKQNRRGVRLCGAWWEFMWITTAALQPCNQYFLFLTIECSQSVPSIIHDNRMFAERAFYCLCAAFKIGLIFL